MIDITQVGNYIKEDLVPGINNLMWGTSYLLNRLRASAMGTKPDGANYVTKVKCQVGANQGQSNSPYVVRSGKIRTVDQTISLRNGHAVVELDEDAIAFAQNDQVMAFMGALAGETGSVVNSIIQGFEIQLQGDGTGKRGTVTTSTNTGGTTYDIVVATENFMWFPLGMIMDMVDQNTGAITGTFEITQTDTATLTLTCTLVAGTNGSPGDFLTNQYEYNNAFMGIYGMIDDGTIKQTLQNINSSTYELWRSKLDDNSGMPRTLTKRMLDEMITWGNRSGGFDIIETTETLQWAVANLLEAQRQFVNVEELRGGWTGIRWAGREIMANIYHRDYRIDFINSKVHAIRQVRHSPNGMFNAVTWLTNPDNSGSMFIPTATVGSKINWKANLNWWFEHVTTDRKADGAIDDVQP